MILSISYDVLRSAYSRKAIQTQLQPYLDDRKAQIDLSNFDMGPLKAAQVRVSQVEYSSS